MKDCKVVGIAQMAICHNPEQIACIGLGSCVAVILYDPLLRMGGIVHVLLPKAPKDCECEEKYADTGTRKLIREMIAKGASKDRLVAKLVGGAQMFANLNLSISDIGSHNCAEARKALRENAIRIVAEETAGKRGRSAYLDTRSGKVTVETAFSPTKVI